MTGEKKKKRGLYILLPAIPAVGLIAFLLWHGQVGHETGKTEKKDTLTWYVDYSWFNGNYPDSLVYKEIEKRTGVRILFETPTESNDSTLNSMISSRDLPDLVTVAPNTEEYSLSTATPMRPTPPRTFPPMTILRQMWSSWCGRISTKPSEVRI